MPDPGATARKRTVTKGEYNRFKKAFSHWIVLFGLTEYEITMQHVALDGGETHAELIRDSCNCTVCVKFAKELVGEAPDPEATALHEALHLLFARMEEVAGRRYAVSSEWTDAEERAVRVLEKVIGGAVGL